MSVNCTKETRLQTLQWKILNNIFPTAVLLHKMGIAENTNCKTCQVTEFSEHFFFYCRDNKKLWEEAENTINSIFGFRPKLSMQNVMVGYLDQKLNQKVLQKINYIILIAKMVVSKVKYGKFRNMVGLFHEELKSRKITS